MIQGEQTFDFEFGVPGVPAVPPGIFDDDSLIPPWLPLPFVMGVLNVVTDDCIMVKHNAFQDRIPNTRKKKTTAENVHECARIPRSQSGQSKRRNILD